MYPLLFVFCFFFFNATATTEIYTYCHTLSLHDALPICCTRNCGWPTSSTGRWTPRCCRRPAPPGAARSTAATWPSTRRSEEHTSELQSLMRISYAVFSLKKKIQNDLIRAPITYRIDHDTTTTISMHYDTILMMYL